MITHGAQNIFCHDARTKQLLWKVPYTGSLIDPYLFDGKYYTILWSPPHYRLIEIEPATGALKTLKDWQSQNRIVDYYVQHDTLYTIANTIGLRYLLSKWSIPQDSLLWDSPELPSTSSFHLAPSVISPIKGTVAVRSRNTFSVLDAKTGILLWDQYFDKLTMGSIVHPIKDRLYLLTGGGSMINHNLKASYRNSKHYLGQRYLPVRHALLGDELIFISTAMNDIEQLVRFNVRTEKSESFQRYDAGSIWKERLLWSASLALDSAQRQLYTYNRNEIIALRVNSN